MPFSCWSKGHSHPLSLRRAILLMSACILASMASRADDTPSALASLESLVAKKSELHLALADEGRTWVQHEQQWRAEIALLKQEKAQLEEAMARVTQSEPSSQRDSAQLLRDQQRLTQSLQGLTPLLERSESALSKWPARLPPGMRASLGLTFKALPQDAQARPATSDGARLQTIIALYSAIEKFQHEIHVVKETHALPDGTRKEMDVLYIGLARAFAVSADAQYAAVGTPDARGWTWQPQPNIADSVQEAVSISRREQPAQWVDLPFQLLEIGE